MSAMLLRRGHDTVLIALLVPGRFAFISPMAFILMWPAHHLFEMKVQRKRRAFLERLPTSVEAVPDPAAS